MLISTFTGNLQSYARHISLPHYLQISFYIHPHTPRRFFWCDVFFHTVDHSMSANYFKATSEYCAWLTSPCALSACPRTVWCLTTFIYLVLESIKWQPSTTGTASITWHIAIIRVICLPTTITGFTSHARNQNSPNVISTLQQSYSFPPFTTQLNIRAWET